MLNLIKWIWTINSCYIESHRHNFAKGISSTKAASQAVQLASVFFIPYGNQLGNGRWTQASMTCRNRVLAAGSFTCSKQCQQGKEAGGGPDSLPLRCFLSEFLFLFAYFRFCAFAWLRFCAFGVFCAFGAFLYFLVFFVLFGALWCVRNLFVKKI